MTDTPVKPTVDLITDVNPDYSVARPKRNLQSFKKTRKEVMLARITGALFAINTPFAVRAMTFLFLRPRRRHNSYLDLMPPGATPIAVYHNLKKLVAYRWGTGEKTILMVHGWESHLGHMLPMVEPLVNAGYSVIALDGPGHGQSPQLLTNMVDYGDAVHSAIEQHGPIYAVIANSFGGAATSLMLGREPQVDIEKLVLLSPMKHILQHIDIFEEVAGYPERHRDALYASINRQMSAPIESCDVADAVKNFDMPGLIVHDLDDRVIPAAGSAEIAKNYAGSILKHTTGLGHKGLVRNRKVQAWVMHFLNS